MVRKATHCLPPLRHIARSTGQIVCIPALIQRNWSAVSIMIGLLWKVMNYINNNDYSSDVFSFDKVVSIHWVIEYILDTVLDIVLLYLYLLILAHLLFVFLIFLSNLFYFKNFWIFWPIIIILLPTWFTYFWFCYYKIPSILD